jgi:hypothetical protein
MKNKTLLQAAEEILSEKTNNIESETFAVLKDGTLVFIDKTNPNETLVWFPKGWNKQIVNTETLSKGIKAIVGKVDSMKKQPFSN